MTSVFLRMFEWLWFKRGSKSARVESAREGVMTWGSVAIGRDMIVGVVAAKS